MNRKIASSAIFLLSIVLGLAVSATLFAFFAGETRIALGVACGSGIALLCGVSWVVGALLTFDAPFQRFLKGTLGFAPLRLGIALVGIVVLGVCASAWVDVTALAGSFAAAHILLQALEGWTFMRLADESSPYPPARPLRFGGFRLW